MALVTKVIIANEQRLTDIACLHQEIHELPFLAHWQMQNPITSCLVNNNFVISLVWCKLIFGMGLGNRSDLNHLSPAITPSPFAAEQPTRASWLSFQTKLKSPTF